MQVASIDRLFKKREDKMGWMNKISGSFSLDSISFTRELVTNLCYLCLVKHCAQRLTSLVDS